MEEKKNDYLIKEQVGNVELVVWPNVTTYGKNYQTIKLRRTYKNSDGEYCSAQAFFPNDLPCIQEVLLRAMNWYRTQSAVQVQEPMPTHAMEEKTPEKSGRKKGRTK